MRHTMTFDCFGGGIIVLGLWMLLDAKSWYLHFPADIPGSGAFNGHFIRDIGFTYIPQGFALLFVAHNFDGRKNDDEKNSGT